MIFNQVCVLVLKGSTGKTFSLLSLPPSPKASWILPSVHTPRHEHCTESITLPSGHWPNKTHQALGWQSAGFCSAHLAVNQPSSAEAEFTPNHHALGVWAPGMQGMQGWGLACRDSHPERGSCTYHSCKGWRSFYLSLHVLWHYLPKHIEQGIRKGYGKGPCHY